jgi:hypothetical protein
MRKACGKKLMQEHSFLCMSIVSYADSNIPIGCQSEQKRYCIYNVKLRCIRITILVVEKHKVLNILSVRL